MKNIDQGQFEKEAKVGLAVVDFSASWCPDCVRIEPIMKVLEEEYSTVKFFKVDIEKNEELKDMLAVRRIPTLLFLKDGVEVTERLVEPDNKLTISQKIDELLAK
ncbi:MULTISPECIES: thioredoxin family protein [unclassified Helicobacter]|uniref:thioredoxin family protein n=1 Tax=unclassified Helicobacter TaxID=2593540 RepID=UPI000CF1B3B1|nr:MULTISPECIES: thioredoxin family protein [unclassified Helicobacter]